LASAHAQAIDDRTDPIGRGRGGEFLFDHQAADKVDAQIEAPCEGDADRQQGERERQPERPAAQADKVDIRIVGDEFQEAHDLFSCLKY